MNPAQISAACRLRRDQSASALRIIIAISDFR
jgi:hypothetical protein